MVLSSQVFTVQSGCCPILYWHVSAALTRLQDEGKSITGDPDPLTDQIESPYLPETTTAFPFDWHLFSPVHFQASGVTPTS